MSVILKDQAAELRSLMAERETPEAPPDKATLRAAHVVTIASGKGGVGKTNIAVNLALCLSSKGHRVVLVDADLGTANVDVILNIRPAFDLSHVLQRSRCIDEIAVRMNPHLRIIAGASGLAAVADLDPFDRRALVDELSRLEADCDIILIDCGAGISQNVLAFAQAADRMLLVITPEPTAMTDAYALVKVLSRTERPPSMGLVVNQSATNREGRQAAERIASVAAKFLKVPLDCDGLIPRDDHVPMAVRARVPLMERYPRCPASAGLSALASKVAEPLSGIETGGGFFRRVLDLFY
ncbi:MAG: MinD/ParA family protein [Phycisphaerae bacterium]